HDLEVAGGGQVLLGGAERLADERLGAGRRALRELGGERSRPHDRALDGRGAVAPGRGRAPRAEVAGLEAVAEDRGGACAPRAYEQHQRRGDRDPDRAPHRRRSSPQSMTPYSSYGRGEARLTGAVGVRTGPPQVDGASCARTRRSAAG